MYDRTRTKCGSSSMLFIHQLQYARTAKSTCCHRTFKSPCKTISYTPLARHGHAASLYVNTAGTFQFPAGPSVTVYFKSQILELVLVVPKNPKQVLPRQHENACVAESNLQVSSANVVPSDASVLVVTKPFSTAGEDKYTPLRTSLATRTVPVESMANVAVV